MKQLLQGNIGKRRQQHCKYQLKTGYAEDRDQQGNARHDQCSDEKLLTAPSVSHMNVENRQRRDQHTGDCEIMNSREMEFRVGMRNST